ncbi:polyamine-modulated factor 1-binding protein 1 isoform X2 [Paroedura picta]
MVEQMRITRPVQYEKEASLHQSWAKAVPLEQLPGELCSSQLACQAGVDQLGDKFQPLQELGTCVGCKQGPHSPLQDHEHPMEKQSLDLLQQHCQLLKDQLFCYEEGTQELEFSQQRERERHRQEQLTQAKHRVGLLEGVLGLYKKKYQALLGRAGELERRQLQLAEELTGQAKAREEAALKVLSLQEELRSRCHQLAQAKDTVARLAQELQGAQEERARGQQHEETIQELREQLAINHTKVLDHEEALAALQKDFSGYQLAHAYSNSCYESQVIEAETLRQKLLQVEGKRSEYQQQAEEYQALVQDLKWELARVSEQKQRATEEAAHLELAIQNLWLETAAERERQQLKAAEQQQQVQRLEAELQQSWHRCAQKEQAILEKDEALSEAQLETMHARSALQEKEQEVAQQQVGAQQLEASLQSIQEELQQSHRECAALRAEAQALQHGLQESQAQEQGAAQELLQQKELVLLAQSRLCHAQEELSKRVAESLHHMQAAQRIEAELRLFKDRATGAEVELEQKRGLLEELTEELSQSKQQCQAAVQEATQHRQAAAQLERRLENSRERLKGLQQRWQEQQQRAQHLQSTAMVQEAENRVLQEQLRQHTTQLEVARRNLKHLQFKLQQQTAEGLQQEAALSQLHTELQAMQEREQQSGHTQALARTLQQQVASCQASQKEALEQLQERSREVFRLQADLQLSQHKVAHLEEELTAYREQAQQLRSQFQTLQRQREEEVRSTREQLGELASEVQHWQDKHHRADQILADKDEELVVLKVEIATLEGKWHVAAEEVKTLEGERDVAQHLFQESQLVEANIRRWIQEQKQMDEKLGHKLRNQIKQIAQLTGERDHLQGLAERLQQENKRLKTKVDELRIEQERFKALHHKAWDHLQGRDGLGKGKCSSTHIPSYRQRAAQRMIVGNFFCPTFKWQPGAGGTALPPAHLPSPPAAEEQRSNSHGASCCCHLKFPEPLNGWNVIPKNLVLFSLLWAAVGASQPACSPSHAPFRIPPHMLGGRKP